VSTPLSRLNTMGEEDFVALLGSVFEHSPWVAQRVVARRPFAGVAQLHQAMVGVVAEAAEAERMALIRAHPDLVGRLAREGRLTKESTREQAAAGLDGLSAEEVEQFEHFNATYRSRFGFPFIICARQNKKASILAAFPIRLANSPSQEVETALGEIYKIAGLRLRDAISE
jgi:2-oxo-4-hydroxy-4-carboxy-5-ureidoimidazoline decarboxylase